MNRNLLKSKYYNIYIYILWNIEVYFIILIKKKKNLDTHNEYPSLIMTITDITVKCDILAYKYSIAPPHVVTNFWSCIPYFFNQ